jgi:hypothetical protein
MEARVQDHPPFLHRRGEHVFITTEDPNYRYEWICSHCGYPLTPREACCPRCQRKLEECPVCSCQRHVRVPCVEPDAQGARRCPACGVRRLPFGDEALKDVEGRFCTNLYGCPAGGLLLRSDEFALLPADASLCPLCRDEHFRPLPVATFTYHVDHCQFCSTLYQSRTTWKASWGHEPDLIGELGQVAGAPLDTCVLCGRQDVKTEGQQNGGDGGDAMPGPRAAADRSSAGDGSNVTPGPRAVADRSSAVVRVGPASASEDNPQSTKATLDEYLRMAELARILMLEPVMSRAFPRLFKAWYAAPGPSTPHAPNPKIGRIVELLLRGTQGEPHRKVLQRRLTEVLQRLEHHFPSGASFPLRLPDGARRGYAGVRS